MFQEVAEGVRDFRGFQSHFVGFQGVPWLFQKVSEGL